MTPRVTPIIDFLSANARSEQFKLESGMLPFPRHIALRLAFLFCLVIGQLFSPVLQDLHAADANNRYKLEAAFIYRFLYFVKWPQEDTTAPLAICVLGENPFNGHLEKLSQRRVKNRYLEIRPIRSETDSECQLLFVSRSEEGRLNEILTAVSRSAVLTVSDIEKFTDKGGMIGFEEVENRLRFRINKNRVSEAGIKLSSQLLKVALR